MHTSHRTPNATARRRGPAAARAQQGVIMIITLLALVLLLIGGIALVRSFGSSALIAGNIAIKRDLLNRGERGVAYAETLLSSGTLATEAARSADALTSNYLSSVQATNDQGIPLALVKDSTFTSLGLTGADIDAGDGITIRYLIDRQCTAAGAFDPATCLSTTASADKGGSSQLRKPGGEARPAYRISVRVTDTRRNTQTYLQMIAGI